MPAHINLSACLFVAAWALSPRLGASEVTSVSSVEYVDSGEASGSKSHTAQATAGSDGDQPVKDEPGLLQSLQQPKSLDVADWSVRLDSIEEARFRVAVNPDEVDMDGRLFLDARADDSDEVFSLSTSLGLWADLDGVARPSQATGLSEIHEPRSLPAWLDLYRLQGRYQAEGLLREVRLGRIVVQQGIPKTMDGAHVLLEPLPRLLEVFAFAGRSVHFFELQDNLFEDWMASVGVGSRPLRNLKIELDYDFQIEDTEGKKGLIEHGYGAQLWYRVGPFLQWHAFVRGIDERISHVGSALRADWAEQDLGAELSFRAQTIDLDELVEVNDPFFNTLGLSRPHLRWRADVYKAFTTDAGVYSLHLGSDGRRVAQGENSAFNRSYGRFYAMVDARDIVVDGPYAWAAIERQAVGDVLDGTGLWTVSGAAGYARKKIRAELGSRYDAYKYTYYYSVDEIQDVRSFYVEGSYQLLGNLRLRGRYLYERFAWDLHTVNISLVQSF